MMHKQFLCSSAPCTKRIKLAYENTVLVIRFSSYLCLKVHEVKTFILHLYKTLDTKLTTTLQIIPQSGGDLAVCPAAA